MELFWYISDAKVDILRQTLPRTWTQDLVLKLKFKAPWLEAEIGHRDIDAAVSNANLIERTLQRDKLQELKPFTRLSDQDSPVFMRFRGRAARMISEEGYWVALHDDGVALLLGGSVAHAIGAQAAPTGHISPSINPFGTAASLNSAGDRKTVSENMAYVWQETWRTGVGTQGASAPTVEGIALFAGRFPAVRSQMRRVGQSAIEHLVVGSPIFVRQVAFTS